MFSWIIENKAKILSVTAWEIVIENTFSEKLEIGQSISHDWACMTVTKFDDEKYSFFAMEESFIKTNFWEKKMWDIFNVERSLKFGWKVDWHFVTGHIDTTWIIDNLEKKSDWSLIFYIKFDKKYNKNVIEKWSVSINWVSLTIVNVYPHLTKEGARGWFSVSLIPLTQEITNLWELQIWNTVNLEFDMMWKYIVNYINNIKRKIKE